MKPVILRPDAAADVEQAYRWYDAQRGGLGHEFMDAVAASLALIKDQPEAALVVRRRTRRVLVSRFPYGIFYRVYDDQVVVVACMSVRRDPSHWRRR